MIVALVITEVDVVVLLQPVRETETKNDFENDTRQTSAVLVAEIRESPDVTKSDSVSDNRQYEFSLVVPLGSDDRRRPRRRSVVSRILSLSCARPFRLRSHLRLNYQHKTVSLDQVMNGQCVISRCAPAGDVSVPSVYYPVLR